MRKKDFSKIETKNDICINVFCYENKLTFPIYNSDQEFENSMDLLLAIDENWSHYVYIKDWQIYVSQNKENTCERVVYNVLVVKMYWQSIKKFVWALMVHNL